MDLRNCKSCGRMFQYEGSEFCTACRKDQVDDFQKVKEYLNENPGAIVPQVVEDTGVSVEKIMKFLKEERLEIKGEAGYILECESCGDKIPSGRFCKNCISNLRGELGSVTKQKKKPEKKKDTKDQFRIIDRYGKK